MKTIPTPFFPFGQDERGFIDAIKHYSDIKAGYDATISSYGAFYTIRQLAVVDDDDGKAVNIGTVPVRNDIPYGKILDELSGIPGIKEAIYFRFFIPLKKGFQVSVNVEFISWDGTEVLAKKTAAGIYIKPDDSGNDPNPFNDDGSVNPDGLSINANEDDYAYLPIVLDGLPDEDLEDKDNFLQTKIKRWKDKTMDISRQLFILRVRQMVWPLGTPKSDLTSKDFEVRDDSVILEIKD